MIETNRSCLLKEDEFVPSAMFVPYFLVCEISSTTTYQSTILSCWEGFLFDVIKRTFNDSVCHKFLKA